MTQEMFDALMEIIDAKIADAGPQGGSDGGLIDAIRVNRAVDAFKAKFVKDEED